jgi:mevalonate kinase
MKLFVPGRICLLGEHSDWAGGYRRINVNIEKGYSLIAGTDQGIYAEVSSHPTSLILSSISPDGQRQGPYEIPMEPKTLMAKRKRRLLSYIAGVAYQALITITCAGWSLIITRPTCRSRKACPRRRRSVLAARAFNRVYDLKLTVRGEMEMAYQGEITTPSRCGRLDQGCAFGNRPVLMAFDGDRLETEELRVNEPLYFVLVDLQAKKDTMEILNRLNRCYPFAENDVERGVQELLGPINKRIVHQAMDALQHADAERLGTLMSEAQSFFDRYAMPACPEELTSPVLHKILDYEALKPHITGGKGVGSQGDGTAQFICRSEDDQQAVLEILQRDLAMPGYKLTITPQQKVRKAVIPAAGFGTRLFPASKATKKELFPIIDRDGIAKPAILLIVEEAIEAGIEEVIIIVQERTWRSSSPLQRITIENYNKLPPVPEYSRRLDMGRRIIRDPTTRGGFGHAVYRPTNWLATSPSC